MNCFPKPGQARPGHFKEDRSRSIRLLPGDLREAGVELVVHPRQYVKRMEQQIFISSLR